VVNELNVKYSLKDIDFEYLEELAELLKPIAAQWSIRTKKLAKYIFKGLLS